MKTEISVDAIDTINRVRDHITAAAYWAFGLAESGFHGSSIEPVALHGLFTYLYDQADALEKAMSEE